MVMTQVWQAEPESNGQISKGKEPDFRNIVSVIELFRTVPIFDLKPVCICSWSGKVHRQ